jgi:hypothetical protein
MASRHRFSALTPPRRTGRAFDQAKTSHPEDRRAENISGFPGPPVLRARSFRSAQPEQQPPRRRHQDGAGESQQKRLHDGRKGACSRTGSRDPRVAAMKSGRRARPPSPATVDASAGARTSPAYQGREQHHRQHRPAGRLDATSAPGGGVRRRPAAWRRVEIGAGHATMGDDAGEGGEARAGRIPLRETVRETPGGEGPLDRPRTETAGHRHRPASSAPGKHTRWRELPANRGLPLARGVVWAYRTGLRESDGAEYG